jgi:succinate dehydrogenase/fumarate reductase flavoprotein subunit
MHTCDVLIIGSEAAGARAAIEAKRYHGGNVMLVSKGRFGKSGATVTAGAGIAVDSKSACELFGLPGNMEDTFEAFYDDTLESGKFINKKTLVRSLTRHAGTRTRELADWGMKITGLFQAPGHRYPRSVYTSGLEIMKALGKESKRISVTILEEFMVTDLLIGKSREIIGAVGVHLRTGEFSPILAKAVVMATGGAHLLYPLRTGPDQLSGDGQAMAWRAGAHLVDMEMTQFNPCTFKDPPAWRGISFPFWIGPEGGLACWLLNRYGERFMQRWDPEKMEKSTRDTLAIAIAHEIAEGRGSQGGGVYYSLRHLPTNLIDFFPHWYRKPNLTKNWTFRKGVNFRKLASDLKRGLAIEVAPAIHFFMGGIAINEKGETTVPGLFAGGEVTGGVHGANRLSCNALPQAFVQGAIAGQSAATCAKKVKHHQDVSREVLEHLQDKVRKPLHRKSGPTSYELRKAIQASAEGSIGVMRDAEGFKNTLGELETLKKECASAMVCRSKDPVYNLEWLECMQIENLLIVFEGILRSGLCREESRGSHYRTDFPAMRREWEKNVQVINNRGRMELALKDVV